MTVIEREDLTQRGKYEDPSIEKVYTDSSNQFIIQKHSVDQNSDFQCRLTIKRFDKKPVRTWRTLQDIKNAVIGEDSVAIEIYPKESEVTDTGNLYHLWVYKQGIVVNAKIIP